MALTQKHGGQTLSREQKLMPLIETPRFVNVTFPRFSKDQSRAAVVGENTSVRGGWG